ncbi:MAG: tRNA lysidine(34) synthetase TilS [Chitinophagales bacterium]
MLASLRKFIETESLFNKGDKLILALSGGKDSMALFDFLKGENYSFEVAHCNFQLRGEESDADADFLRAYCSKNDIVCHVKLFDTTEEAKRRRLSIQECARELRYAWFEELRREVKAKYILSAHHLDDNIETLVYKLVKGTGIKGIRGILPKQEHLVRPLLNTSREEIEAYIQDKAIPYREDSSNASKKYARNKIRLDLLPVLREINPSLSASFVEHFERWRDLEMMQEEVAKSWHSKLMKEDHGEFLFLYPN